MNKLDLLLIGAISSATAVAQSDGVTVPLQSGALRIQPIANGVMRVRFSKSGSFPAQRVPVLINLEQPRYTVRDRAGSLTVATNEIVAVLDKKSGALSFKTADGRKILSEVAGSRSLTPETLPGQQPAHAYRSRLAFQLTPTEGIYGLGQHQDGYMDYRGSSVALEQVNREIAIPFLVSSNGYGLLWNNPSHTDVNVASESTELPVASELDENAKPGGFTAKYYTGERFDSLATTTKEAKIDHDWDKVPPAGLPQDHYSARWTGSIQAPISGSYLFKTVSDDGVRLWVDGRTVIDNWSVHAPTVDQARVALAKGTRHSIRLEYFQSTGGAIMRFTCGIQKPSSTLEWRSEAADDIDYCVFYGPWIDDVMARYRHATGDAPLPPETALGYWQSKEHYATQDEWDSIAAEYRERRHPIDNIVQDWFYWDPWPWGSHKFDPKRYPDPAAGIAELHDKYHMQFMISVWGKFLPGSAEYPNANRDLMDAKGFLYPELDYYDAFNPDARKLYWQLMRNDIFKFGVDAWWLDASEPELDMQAFRKTETAAGLGSLVLNGWPLMHTVGVSSGQLETAPDKRVFILTRSAYAGQQRTGAACWSGDITATWKVYADQIPAGLNFGLSGIPYWTTDIGAFFVPGNLYPKGASDPGYRELFTRWFQFGAFCPIFRVHGTDFAKEMWRFGPETEKTLNKYDELRYRLMPYIYSQAWHVTSRGGTIMRALVMDFPKDTTAREVKDEFMFGPSLLICPVIKPGVTSRKVYLPAGTGWYDFWSGKSYAGGENITADAPIDKLPIFVRAGTILPLGPVIQYIGEKPEDPIELRIYPGANANFTLYEDAGNNNDYRKGLRSIIPISWNDQSKVVRVGQRQGSYPGMLQQRSFTVTRGESKISSLRYSGSPVSAVVSQP
ncbi:MAG TPA: TIM-barrel domain-containing protein [Fimbriimonadaceae bacterium]